MIYESDEVLDWAGDSLRDELVLLGKRHRRLSSNDVRIARDQLYWCRKDVLDSGSDTVKALSLIPKADLVQFVLNHLKPKRRFNYTMTLQYSSAWLSSTSPQKTSMETLPNVTTRPELAPTLEELIRVVKTAFTGGKAAAGRNELIDSISVSRDLTSIAHILVKFILRRLRVLHRFGKLSTLLCLLRLLTAVIQNPRFDAFSSFNESVAGLVMLIASPNLLQSSSVTAQTYLRRAASRVVLVLFDRIGSPTSVTLRTTLGAALLPVLHAADPHSSLALGLRHFFTVSRMQLV